MQRRRVVTGHTPDGTSVLTSDEQVEAITVALIPGGEFHAIWGADQPVTLPLENARPAADGWFPPAGGFRLAFVTIPPDSATIPADFDLDAALAEFHQNLPGMAEVLEPENPGMHTTDTVDLLVIISGSVRLELDNGTEVELHAGDSAVQNGTRHAWRNRSAQPCVMAVAIIGATRTE